MVTWKTCPGGFVYKGRLEPGDIGYELVGPEDAVYLDLRQGIAYETVHHRGSSSVLVRGWSLKQHPEIIEAVRLSDRAGTALVQFITGAIEHEPDVDLWFSGLPDKDQATALNAILDVAYQIASIEAIPYLFEERSLVGESSEVLTHHGIYC